MIVKRKFEPSPAAFAWKPGTMMVVDLMKIAHDFHTIITISSDGYQIEYDDSIKFIKSGQYLVIDGETFEVMEESAFYETYEVVG